MTQIAKKRIGSLTILTLTIDGSPQIYTRNMSDGEHNDLLVAISDYESGKDDNLEGILDIIDPKRVAKRLEEEAAKIRIEEEAREIGYQNKEEAVRKAKAISAVSDLFEDDGEGNAYLVGYSQIMPKILVEAILDSVHNPKSNYTLNSLINFWKWLLLNPDEHVRVGLFKWLNTGKFALTHEGMIISYRNVNVKSKGVDQAYADFINNSWVKVKGWKHSPKHYVVCQDENGLFLKDTRNKNYDSTEYDIEGNLDTLYERIKNSSHKTIYTGQHRGQYGQHVEIGKPVAMPRKECDNDPGANCSRGLHQKSKTYGNSFGSVQLVCLVNPYNVVAIPNYDTSKFRCCEYFPIGIPEKDSTGDIQEMGPGTYDFDYANYGEEQLEKLFANNSLQSLKDSGQISNNITQSDIDNLISSMLEVTSKRIQKI